MESVPLHSGTKFVLCDLYHSIVVLNLYCGISTTSEWFSICTGPVWGGQVGGWLVGWMGVSLCVCVCVCLCVCVCVCVCLCVEIENLRIFLKVGTK